MKISQYHILEPKIKELMGYCKELIPVILFQYLYYHTLQHTTIIH